MINFGNRLKLLRIQKKLTQAQLAQRIGITKSMISAYETSMRLPSLDVLVKLSYELRVTTDYLLGVDIKDDLDIPLLSESQKKAVLNMILAFKEDE